MEEATVGGGVDIQMQIQQLQDQQERVQKKTFTNWMNTYLKQRSPPMKVKSLFEDIKDGVVLLSLLEVLSGNKLQMEKGKLNRVHYVSNLSTALKFLESKRIKLVNINVSDIADGKPSIILGLIWTIILYFQIEDTLSQQATIPADEEGRTPKKLSALDKFRMNAKKALLVWTGNAITKRYGIEINDFGKSWRDGLAFSAMVHTIRPDLVVMDKLRKQSARVNLENAFSTAEKHLGIARLLDPEDVDVEKPDERSVMTYIAQFLKAYPEAGEDPALSRKIKTPAEQEMAEYTKLMQWLTEEADEVLKTVEEPIPDRKQEYMDYIAFKLEVDCREQTYIKIGEKIQTGQTGKLTKDHWQQLDTKWDKMARKTRMWLWKLDANLPGKLGQLGDWLNQAEEVLAQEEVTLENTEEMAFQLGKILQEHRVYFKDIEGNKKFFLQVKRAGKYERESIPGPQLENLAARLNDVCKLAPLRECRLEYEQLRYRLLAFLVAAETKLRIWSVKHGQQESVEELLVDYQTFVHHGKLFQNYDKIYEECKAKAEIYRKQGTEKNEVDKMNNYFDEVTVRWKKISVEIKSVKSILEEVIDSWKKFSSILDSLIGWHEEAEDMMTSRSTQDKKQFFADIGPYEEKVKIINEAGKFLIENCQEPIAAEIRQTVQMINKPFSELSDKHQHFQQVEVIGRARKEYQDGIMRITQWLKNAEELMVHEVPCRHADLKEHLTHLDTCHNQLPKIESDIKVTRKTAQSLVKDSTQEGVTDMLQTLNVQKDIIVQLRKEIPERIKEVKAMLPNSESLETGVLDLLAWIEKGEALLATHKLDGTQEKCESMLEKHKDLFSEITYQKSILESTNKVYQIVNSIKPKLQNVNYALVDQPMEQLNERFMACVSSSKTWEKNLENLSRLWRTHQQKQQLIENWLAQAEAVLDDTDDDHRSQLKKHKQFFTRVEDRLPQEYQQACQDILMVLEEEDRPPLTELMKHTLARWKAVTENAPVKLTKLEFSLEDQFCKNMENAEKTVHMHNQTLAQSNQQWGSTKEDGGFVQSINQSSKVQEQHLQAQTRRGDTIGAPASREAGNDKRPSINETNEIRETSGSTKEAGDVVQSINQNSKEQDQHLQVQTGSGDTISVPASTEAGKNAKPSINERNESRETPEKFCVLKLLTNYVKSEGDKVEDDTFLHRFQCSFDFQAIWNFCNKKDCGRKILDAILVKHHCLVSLAKEQPFKGFCLFQILDQKFKKKSDVKKFMDVILTTVCQDSNKELLLNKFTVDPRLHNDVLETVRQTKELDCVWIEFGGEQGQEVCMVCLLEHKMIVTQRFSDIVKATEECFKNHEETVSVDFMWHRVMVKFGYLEKVNNKFPNLIINWDESNNVFVFKGPRDEARSAANTVLEILGTAQHDITMVTFSPGCQLEIFTYPEMCDYINSVIPQVDVAWSLNHLTKKIHLFAKDPKQLHAIDKIIKGCVQERFYPVLKDHAISTQTTSNYLEGLKNKYTGRLVIHVSASGLLVTTADDIYENVDAAIQEIISGEGCARQEGNNAVPSIS